MPRLMPKDIVKDVADILFKASPGKGTEPGFLTAYQILSKLKPAIKNTLIQQRGRSGKGSGHQFAAASVVAMAVQLLNKAYPNKYIIEYLDTSGIKITSSNGKTIVPSFSLCGIYRAKVNNIKPYSTLSHAKPYYNR